MKLPRLVSQTYVVDDELLKDDFSNDPFVMDHKSWIFEGSLSGTSPLIAVCLFRKGW